jgi:hypothetical protein
MHTHNAAGVHANRPHGDNLLGSYDRCREVLRDELVHALRQPVTIALVVQNAGQVLRRDVVLVAPVGCLHSRESESGLEPFLPPWGFARYHVQNLACVVRHGLILFENDEHAS